MTIPRLIIIDGLPGSGKSTMSQHIHFQLESNGIPAKWFYEIQKDNPLRPLGYISQSTRNDLIDISLAKWDEFYNNAKHTNEIYIIDGGMFQNTMRYFFHNELLPNKIEDYFVKVQEYVSELDGIIIYLFHDNVKNFVNQTIKYRGQEFEKVVEEYIVNTKYGKKHKLSGHKGVLTFWKNYEKFCTELFDKANARKHPISIEDKAWPIYHKEICDVLGIEYFERHSLISSETASIVGEYISEDRKFKCRVNIIDGQLKVTNILKPLERESVLLETHAYQNKMFNLRGSRVFLEFESTLSNTKMKIITDDNWKNRNGMILEKILYP